MLPICIAIIILAISVIILSIVCLRLNKKINTPVKYVDGHGFEVSVPYLANAVSSLQDKTRELQRHINDDKIKDDISGLKADYTKLVNYLATKQGVSCNDCIHKSVCDSNKTMCKSEHFGFDFKNGAGLVIKSVGLCSKFIAKKDEVDLSKRDELLGNIKAEMHATAEKHEDGDYYLRDQWVDEIIDKYEEKPEC